MPILGANDLGKRFGRRRWALRGINLQIAAGGITALVGPNGAGKSTLLRSWVGFERPTTGSALVAGHDAWRDRRSALSRVGYVSQSPALYESLSVEEHLRMAGFLRPAFDREMARSRLDALGIPLESLGGRLSGGQQAQVILSIALATHPEVLLLDEPLAQLDPLARREFLQLVVGAVRGEGTTALLSSHIVTDIEQACDRLIVLGSGKLLLQTSIEDALACFSISSVSHQEQIVGQFPDPGGMALSLIHHERAAEPPESRPASLEEIVLGHLSALRQSGEAVN